MSEPVSLSEVIEEVTPVGEAYIRQVGTAMAGVVSAFRGAADQLVAGQPETPALSPEETT